MTMRMRYRHYGFGHKMLIGAIPKAGDKPVENQSGIAAVAAPISLPKFQPAV